MCIPNLLQQQEGIISNTTYTLPDCTVYINILAVATIFIYEYDYYYSLLDCIYAVDTALIDNGNFLLH
jgi:hypothetical protein